MELQTQLQGDFQEKLFPILNQMVVEKGLHVLLSAADAAVANASLDEEFTRNGELMSLWLITCT
jgi:hypothetical protein